MWRLTWGGVASAFATGCGGLLAALARRRGLGAVVHVDVDVLGVWGTVDLRLLVEVVVQVVVEEMIVVA